MSKDHFILIHCTSVKVFHKVHQNLNQGITTPGKGLSKCAHFKLIAFSHQFPR